MRLKEFERLVLEELLSEQDFLEYINENTIVVEEALEGDNEVVDIVVENIEFSTLEYLEEISKIPPLTQEGYEEKFDNFNVDTKDEIISSSLRIPIRLAMLVLKDGIDFMDLIQEGTISLILATDSFVSSNYNEFEKYATVIILRRMILSIEERVEETKAEFIHFFTEKKQEFFDKEEVIKELENKIKYIEKIDYFSLINSLTNLEIGIVSDYYGFREKILSMYEIEKRYNLESGNGEEIFQKIINKLSKFGGELIRV